jgi:hypothetical protein
LITAPIVAYELKHPSVDGALLALCSLPLGGFTSDESREAYRRVRAAADGGSGFAMCMCAHWPNVHGQGKVTDSDRYQWSERAAQSGYPPGLFELAVCFEEGIGVPADIGRARELYELSSQGGFGFATHRLARAHMEGTFGTQDAALAVHLMERSHEQGEPMAAFYLGQWFESARGVLTNPYVAVSWYERASVAGNVLATLRLMRAYSRGELGLPRDTNLAKKYERLVLEQTKIDAPGVLPQT